MDAADAAGAMMLERKQRRRRSGAAAAAAAEKARIRVRAATEAVVVVVEARSSTSRTTTTAEGALLSMHGARPSSVGCILRRSERGEDSRRNSSSPGLMQAPGEIGSLPVL